MKLFLLNKTDIKFSSEEVLSLYKPKNFNLVEDILFFNTKKDFSNRIILTKKVFNLINMFDEDNIEESLRNLDWDSIVSGSFKVRCGDISLEKIFANIIYNKLNSPKVDLKNPDTQIYILKREKIFYVCILEKSISTSWKNRMPHLKPELSPTSLNPRIAIAMINLAGIPKGVLCDPFCGTGGIMVEGGLLGYKTLGFDIDNLTIKKANVNLNHFKITNYNIFEEDALTNNQKFDFVVTDLPYGKNTKVSQSLKSLYQDFFKIYYELCDVMVIGLPDFIEYKGLLGDWKVEKEFDVYLHKSLSKKILKLNKII